MTSASGRRPCVCALYVALHVPYFLIFFVLDLFKIFYNLVELVGGGLCYQGGLLRLVFSSYRCASFTHIFYAIFLLLNINLQFGNN